MRPRRLGDQRRFYRDARGYGAAVLTGLVAASVLQGALEYYGASHAIVYGIYPPTAQLIVLGTIGAVIAASREDWLGSAPRSRLHSSLRGALSRDRPGCGWPMGWAAAGWSSATAPPGAG